MPHAVIVGAGIAGLVSARPLSARGWSVTLFERAPAHAPVGAGIILGANALACLERLGLGAALAARGEVLGTMTVWDAAGCPLQELTPADVHPAARLLAFHHPPRGGHRGAPRAARRAGGGRGYAFTLSVGEIAFRADPTGATSRAASAHRSRPPTAVGC